MKKILFTALMFVVGVIGANALTITSFEPEKDKCTSYGTVYWKDAPSSGVKLITFSFKKYEQVWRVYDYPQGSVGSYRIMYDPDLNPDSLVIKMYDSTDEKKTPIASAGITINDYPYAVSQKLYYDNCTSSISLHITTQRPVSSLRGENMVAVLYDERGERLKQVSLPGTALSDFTYHFTQVPYSSGKKYSTSVYATDNQGKMFNYCGIRTTEPQYVAGTFSLDITGATAVKVPETVLVNNAIRITYVGDVGCSNVKVMLERTTADGVTEDVQGFSYVGGSVQKFDDVSVVDCVPYSYQLVSYDNFGKEISRSKATDYISLSNNTENVIKFTDVYASLAEYADKVMISWKMTNASKVRKLSIKRAVSTNPSRFTTVFTTVDAVNTYVDNAVQMGTYYLYRIEVVNEDNCTYTSPVVSGFAASCGTASGLISYSSEMGTPNVQVVAKLADNTTTFARQGSFRSFGNSMAYCKLKDEFDYNAFTWQGWIKMNVRTKKSVVYRQKDMFRIVVEGSNVMLTLDDDNMVPIVKARMANVSVFNQVTVTYNGVKAAIYLDGNLAAESELALNSSGSSEVYVMAADTLDSEPSEGYVDDIRLWSVAQDSITVRKNYQSILAGDESDLFSYWKFDEQGLSVVVDYAHANTIGQRGNHLKISGSNTYSNEVPENLHCMGYSDDSGYYRVPGIPIEAKGSTYNIIPYKEGTIFSPGNKMVMFDQYNAIAQNINFTDKTSYNVYLHVMYKGTKVPVSGVGVQIDGVQATKDNSQIVTDSEGYVMVSVGKGDHTLTVSKDKHVFSAIVGKGGGSYVGSFHADVEKAYAIELCDSTMVNVFGRIAGGKEEGQKAVGFGESKNNIGVKKMVLRFKNQDLATCDLLDDGQTSASEEYEYHRLVSYWADEPHYSESPSNLTKVEKRKNGNVWEWIVTPDQSSGEYVMNLYPEEYEVVSIDYFAQPSGAKLDYTATFTPAIDTTSANDQTIQAIVKKLDYMGVPIGLPDDTVSITRHCDFRQDYALYSAPQVEVWQDNADGGSYFGSKTYKVGDKDVELYTKDGKYTVYKNDPVFIQDNQYDLLIRSVEIYYPNADNPMVYTYNGGVFTVLNEFGHIDGSFTVTGGNVWKYRFKASNPRFGTGDYRQHLKIYLTSDGVDYYWKPDLGEGNDQCTNNEMPGVVIGRVDDPSSQFVTKGPEATAFVLRDPPGNASTSSLMSGTTYSFSYSAKDSNGPDGTYHNSKGSFHLGLGAGGSSTSSSLSYMTGLTTGITFEGTVSELYSLKFGVGTTMEWETYDYTTQSYTYTSSISSQITTSTSEAYTASEGDVYVGNSINIIFSDSHHLDIKLDGDKPVLYEFDNISKSDEIGTQFLYTQKYLVSTLIPQMSNRVDELLIYDPNPTEHTPAELFSKYPESVTALYLTQYEKGDRNYGKLNSYTAYFRPGSKTQVDEVAFYIQSITNWKKSIAHNEKIKTEAFSDPAKYGWTVQNYSFDGSHSLTKTIEFDFASDSVRTRGYKFYVGLYESFTGHYAWFSWDEALNSTFRRDADFEKSNTYIKDKSVNINMGDGGGDYPSEESKLAKSKKGTMKMSFTLADTHLSNTYSVDVYIPQKMTEKTMLLSTSKDELDSFIYGLAMPIFRLRAGTTSCIHYDGDSTHYLKEIYGEKEEKLLNAKTKRGEEPQILINGMKTQSVVNQNPDAIIPLEIQVSEGSTAPSRLGYTLLFSSETGAITVNNTDYNMYLYRPAKDKPEKRYVYLQHIRPDITTDSIAIIAHSQCQYVPNYYGKEQIADTAWVHVSYRPVAPVPTLKYVSRSNVVNKTNDSINIDISQFGKNYKNLTDLVLEYRGENDVQWQTKYYFALTKREFEEQEKTYPGKIRLVEDKDTINYTYRFTEADGDGKYITRVRADIKANGEKLDSKYSDNLELIKDVNAPYIVSVTPSDGILGIGDNISLSTNEDVYISSIISDKVEITGVMNGQVDKEGNNRGLQFDGATMNAKSTYQYNMYDRSFTVEGWVWHNGNPGVIFSQGRAGEAYFELAVNDNNNLVINMLQDGTVSTYTLNETLKSNQWTHIAAVYDKELKRVDFLQGDAASTEQVDGRGFNKKVTPYSGYTQNYKATGSVYVASDVASANNFSGRVRDLRFWNKALSSAEINANSNVSLSGSEIGLLGYWKMDELEGNVATDKATAHNLQHNATWFLHPGGFAMVTTPKDTLEFTSPGLDVSDYTLEFWFKSKGETDGYLFKRECGSELSVSVNGGKLSINEGPLSFALDGNYLDGNWHNMAISVSHYGEAHWYVDGKLVRNSLASEVGQLDCKFIMGAGVVTSVDNVRIWKYAMDATGIKNVMHTRSVDSESIADYYPFDKMNELNTDLITTTYSIAGAKGNVTVLSETPKDSLLFFTAEAALVDAKTNAERLIPTVVREQRGMTLALDEFDEKPYRLQDCELNVLVSTIAVQDLHGNYMENNKQWSVFVDNKRLVWDIDDIHVDKAIGDDYDFTASFHNRYAKTQYFTIENLPSWLCADVNIGSLSPLATKKIHFTIDPSLPVGDYEEVIYLKGDGNLVDKFLLTVSCRADAPIWSADCSNTDNLTQLVARVKINGYYPECEENMLAAFIGENCVGVAHYSADAKGLYMMSLCPSSAEAIEFRYWDATTGTIYTNLESNQNIVTNKPLIGTPTNPVEFTVTGGVSFNIPVNAGYTWVSINVDSEGAADMKALFRRNPNVLSIKNQRGQFAIRSSFETPWFSTLPKVETSQMYVLTATDQKPWEIVGKPVNPADVNISVHGSADKAKWSWIGYTPSVSMTVAEAMSLHTPTEYDMIAGQNGFAIYDSNFGWVGTLKAMVPGAGYKYLSSQEAQFVYPSTTSAKRVALADANTHFVYDPYLYPNSMNVIAVIADYNIQAADEIGWFKGSECRGGATAIQYGDHLILCGQIFGDVEGDELTARLYKAAENTEYNINENVKFKSDDIQGSPENPIVYTLGTVTTADETADVSVILSPVPVKDILTVTTTEDINSVEVYDMSGKLVAEGSEYHINLSHLAPGNYTVKVILERDVYIKKIIKE